MCCSVSPDVEVRFSETILYAAEVVNLQGKTVHVLGYQNRAQNNVAGFNLMPKGIWKKLKNVFTPTRQTTGNAMILPFPAVPRTMSKANVLDTEKCPHILKDIADAVQPPPPILQSLSIGRSLSQPAAVEIFEAAGIYTVVLAQDARAIPDALDQVPKDKRPKLNPELFEAYAKWYPDWTIALCCFNNNEAQEALPMLWWYEPMNPEILFLPALDCHTGSVPSLHSSVQVDHTLAAGSLLREKNNDSPTVCERCSTRKPGDFSFCINCGFSFQTGNYKTVYYSGNEAILNEIRSYLLTQVMGGVYHEMMPNGDFICQIDEVRKGIWNPVRTLPQNI